MVTVTQKNQEVELSGEDLRDMFTTATSCLERNAAAIDALNVFPVPDGDTGTNMLLTMKSLLAETEYLTDTRADSVVEAMAHGALMGARGNSGVILSQIMKGFAAGFSGKEVFGTREMVDALRQASIAAYESMTKPREGTMLTVIKDVATAVEKNVVQNDGSLVALMETAVEEAKNSVARTPQLLDVLRDAGVVDAGGQGIYVILEGILRYLKNDAGDTEMITIEAQRGELPTLIPIPKIPNDEKIYGYCTELIIKGDELRQDQIRRWMEKQGESVLVVGDEETIKVHVHTLHPGTVIEFAISLGSVHDLKIQNMDDQHEDFLKLPDEGKATSDIAIVAVVAGAGLQNTFRSLGTTAIIPGGQTMNPSCSDILQVIDSTSADEVILLPNNKNIISAAKQVVTAAKQTVKVIPTQNIPQGLSALLAFNPGIKLEENLIEMTRAQEGVKSVEITTAVRDTKLGRMKLRKGDYIALINGNIKITNESLNQVVFDSLQAANAEKADIITLFYGDEVSSEKANKLLESLRNKFTEPQIELIQGGQLHYPYIISVE